MKVILYYTQGTSDKVYTLEKVATGANFVINFAYGRRGSTLKTGTKTANPVNETTADKVFTKFFNEKVSEGYTDCPSGVPFTPCNFSLSQLSGTAAVAPTFTAPANPQPTGISVQLLNPIEDAELEALYLNDRFAAQEKFDGKRIVNVLENGEVYGVNGSGLRCGIPASFTDAVKRIAEIYQQVNNSPLTQLMLDGEGVGDNFYAFDLLEINGFDFRNESYERRYERLKIICQTPDGTPPVKNLFVSDLITGENAKRKFVTLSRSAGLEGVVFKNLDAYYEAGRPNSGGNQFKYKFCCEATCLVSAQNGTKRSVALQVADGSGGFVNIGNCTIPANFNIPSAGALVEIRYLYAYRNGALYQPVYKGERSDKTAPDTYQSLKFKAEAVAA